MPYLIIELSKYYLRVAHIKKSKKNTVVHSVESFPLPFSILEIKTKEQEEAFKSYVETCVASVTTKKTRAFLILNTELYYSKEFNHPPARAGDLQKLALLEADAFFQGKGSQYIIENLQRSQELDVAGMHQSVFYAIHKDLFNLVCRVTFIKQLKICRIVPQLYAFSKGTQTIIKDEGNQAILGNNCLAILDFGREFTRLVVYNNGNFVHEHHFASTYPDTIKVIMEGLDLDRVTAELYLQQKVSLEDKFDPEQLLAVSQRVQVIISSMVKEVLQGLQIVISSERLRLDRLLISGLLTKMPGFLEYLSHETDKPCDLFSNYLGNLNYKLIWLPLDITLDQVMAMVLFMLPVGSDKKNAINFLQYKLNKQRHLRRQISLFSSLIFLVLAVFSILPMVYQTHIRNQDQYQKILNLPEYQAIRVMTDRISLLEQEKLALLDEQIRLDQLPQDRNRVLKELHEVIQGKVKLQGFAINPQNKEISLDFIAASINDYVELKNAINQHMSFKVLVPFNIHQEDEGKDGITGTVTLIYKEVEHEKD